MKLHVALFLTLTMSSLGAAHGQAYADSKQVAVSQGDPAKAVDALAERLEHEITSAAQAMPADKYDFTPASLNIPGSNFVKVRSFADQVKHVAQANYSIAANIVGKDPVVDVNAIGRLKSKSDILATLAESFVAVHRAIATITPANANDVIDDVGVGPNQTRESEAAWVAVHGYDHYGQMVEYLRMNGITPKP